MICIPVWSKLLMSQELVSDLCWDISIPEDSMERKELWETFTHENVFTRDGSQVI